MREVVYAATRKIPIIPVLIEPCKVEGLLSYSNSADLTNRSDVLRRLIEAVDHLREQTVE